MRRPRHREAVICSTHKNQNLGLVLLTSLFTSPPRKVGIKNDGTHFIGWLCRFDVIKYIKHLTKGLEHNKHSILRKYLTI